MEQFSKKKQLAMQNKAIDTEGRGVVCVCVCVCVGGGVMFLPPTFLRKIFFFLT